MKVTITGWRPNPRVCGMNRSRAVHWATISRANNEAKRLTLAALGPRGEFRVPGPWRVTLAITVAAKGGRLADGDNLQSQLKAVRDAVAAWIGVDDGSADYEWVYPPARRSHTDSVGIEIETR